MHDGQRQIIYFISWAMHTTMPFTSCTVLPCIVGLYGMGVGTVWPNTNVNIFPKK